MNVINVLPYLSGYFCDDQIFAFFTISLKLQIIEYAEVIFCIIFN